MAMSAMRRCGLFLATRWALALLTIAATPTPALAWDETYPETQTTFWTVKAAENHYCSATRIYDGGSTVSFTGVDGKDYAYDSYVEIRWFNPRWGLENSPGGEVRVAFEFGDGTSTSKNATISRSPGGIVAVLDGRTAFEFLAGLKISPSLILRPGGDPSKMVGGVKLDDFQAAYAELDKCWTVTGSRDYRHLVTVEEEKEATRKMEAWRAENEARKAENARIDAENERIDRCDPKVAAVNADLAGVRREEKRISDLRLTMSAERALLETRSNLGRQGVPTNAAQLNADIHSWNERSRALDEQARQVADQRAAVRRRLDALRSECPQAFVD